MSRLTLLTLLFCSAVSNAASHSNFQVHNVSITEVVHQDRDAVRVVETERSTDEDKLAILNDSEMRDGEISGWISGSLVKDAAQQARGFVGIAFRIDESASSFEAIYLRPTNARADDQLRRNHSMQYISFPDYPWHRLRRETPGKYESYTDMVPGEWIHYRLVVAGATARLYLHQSDQPSLIVNDLKLAERSGRVGLWIGPGTEGHFSDITVSPR